MRNFFKNHWASIFFVLCSCAIFIAENFIVSMSMNGTIPIGMVWLFGYVIIWTLAYIFARGTNIYSKKSGLIFLALCTIVPIIHGVLGAYIVTDTGSALQVFLCIIFCLVSPLGAIFVMTEKTRGIRKT